jgi:hypothetical protein
LLEESQVAFVEAPGLRRVELEDAYHLAGGEERHHQQALDPGVGPEGAVHRPDGEVGRIDVADQDRAGLRRGGAHDPLAELDPGVPDGGVDVALRGGGVDLVMLVDEAHQAATESLPRHLLQDLVEDLLERFGRGRDPGDPGHQVRPRGSRLGRGEGGRRHPADAGDDDHRQRVGELRDRRLGESQAGGEPEGDGHQHNQ